MEQIEKADNIDPVAENSDAGILFVDIAGFIFVLKEFTEAVNRIIKRNVVRKILNDFEWHQHYENRRLGTKVLSGNGKIEYEHEKETAIKLANQGYYVVFVPKALFKRNQKRYDVILIKDHVKLEADLKSVTSTNVDTIAKRIKNGIEQACRVVLDIKSDISTKELIQSLRSVTFRNDLLKEVWIFHKKKFYILSKNLIVSNRIYTILK